MVFVYFLPQYSDFDHSAIAPPAHYYLKLHSSQIFIAWLCGQINIFIRFSELISEVRTNWQENCSPPKISFLWNASNSSDLSYHKIKRLLLTQANERLIARSSYNRAIFGKQTPRQRPTKQGLSLIWWLRCIRLSNILRIWIKHRRFWL